MSKDAEEIITCSNFLPFIDMVTPENPIDVVNGRFFLSSYFLFRVYAHEMCFYDLQHQDKLIQGCLLLILSHLKTRGRVFSNRGGMIENTKGLKMDVAQVFCDNTFDVNGILDICLFTGICKIFRYLVLVSFLSS